MIEDSLSEVLMMIFSQEMTPEIFGRINPFSRTLNGPHKHQMTQKFYDQGQETGVQVSVRVDIQRELNWNLIHPVLYKVAMHGSPWRCIRLSLLLDKPCNICFLPWVGKMINIDLLRRKQTTSSPRFFLRDSKACETLARVKITPREKRRHAAGREKNALAFRSLYYP